MGEAARKIDMQELDAQAAKFEIFVPSDGSLTNRQIDNRMKRIAELDAAIKQMQAERDDLKEQVAASVNGERRTAHWAVKNQKVTSFRFDSSAFKDDHPRLYEEYRRLSTSFRFTYKAI